MCTTDMFRHVKITFKRVSKPLYSVREYNIHIPRPILAEVPEKTGAEFPDNIFCQVIRAPTTGKWCKCLVEEKECLQLYYARLFEKMKQHVSVESSLPNDMLLHSLGGNNTSKFIVLAACGATILLSFRNDASNVCVRFLTSEPHVVGGERK